MSEGIKGKLKTVLESAFPVAMEMRAIRKTDQYREQRYIEYIHMPKEERARHLAENYRAVMGRELNLDDPKCFSEKINWRMIYDNHPVYTELSDKYLVREWVKRKIGEEYLVPLFGVWDSFDEIDFDALPDAFVLKTNNGSGTNIIVSDKRQLNRKTAKGWIDLWMKYPYSIMGYEGHYDQMKPRVIAEELLKPEPGQEDISDYKFLCFDGRPYYCWVDVDRRHGHKRNLYDIDWNEQNWQFNTCFPRAGRNIPRPRNYDRMVEIVRKLCAGFAHVRVDLYNIDGKIYFGEMTFTTGNGLEKCEPDEMDYELGKLWDIHKPQVDERVVNG